MNANNLIMRELGNALVHKKDEFVELLNYSGIPADVSMSDLTLVNKFMDNIHANEKLLIGSAYLVNKNNKVVGFDGEHEVSDQGVKRSIHVLHNYFDGTMVAEIDPNEEYYASSKMEPMSGVIPGLGTAIATAVGEGAKLGTQISAGQQKKKFGAMDMATKKQEAKQQMISQIIAQKQTEAEAKKKEAEEKGKKTRTALIVGGSIVVVGLIVAVVLIMRKKAKNG